MQPLEQACPRCGRPFASAQQAPPVFSGRVQRHVQTVGILWIVWAGWTALGWLIALPFVLHAFGGHAPWAFQWPGSGPWQEGFPLFSNGWLAETITVIVLIRSALAVVTGVALLRRAPWARTLALVTSFLTLIKPVTGTILSIYTLWVLLPAASNEGYRRIARRPGY